MTKANFDSGYVLEEAFINISVNSQERRMEVLCSLVTMALSKAKFHKPAYELFMHAYCNVMPL